MLHRFIYAEMSISLRAFRDSFFKAMLLALSPTANPISLVRLKEYAVMEFEMFMVFFRWDFEAAREIYRYQRTATLSLSVFVPPPTRLANILSALLIVHTCTSLSRDTPFAQVLCDGATLKNHQKSQAISMVLVRPEGVNAEADAFHSGVKETICIGFKKSPSNTALDASNLVLETICKLLDVSKSTAQDLINSVVTDYAAMSTGAAMKPHEIIAACECLPTCHSLLPCRTCCRCGDHLCFLPPQVAPCTWSKRLASMPLVILFVAEVENRWVGFPSCKNF